MLFTISGEIFDGLDPIFGRLDELMVIGLFLFSLGVRCFFLMTIIMHMQLLLLLRGYFYQSS